ncbi:MAG: hypothetical protein OXC40_00200, partial [Proteobacteria bacterium]|nr:hypothetical protein [Pseudomonadota bacterium]
AYAVHVSGIETNSLTQILIDQDLDKSVIHRNEEGFSHHLVFRHYESSRAALNVFLNQGVIIQSFTPAHTIEERIQMITEKLMAVSSMPEVPANTEKNVEDSDDQVVEQTENHEIAKAS